MPGNLARAPRRRSAEETWRIKQAVRDWLAAAPEQRPTQQDLARQLGVSKQYINRLVHRLPPTFQPPQPPSAQPQNAPPPAQSAGIPIRSIWTPGREQTDALLREWAGIARTNRGNS
jgi:hypothetical protein